MFEFTINEEENPILVEFESQLEVQRGSLSLEAVEEIAKKSAYALNYAMNTIRTMADRITETIDKVAEKPAKVTVEFGLKLDAEAGAFIARAGTEANFLVSLTWEKED